MAENDDARMVVIFKDHPILNEAKTKAEGRPIYDSMEVCEIRFAGDRNTVGVYPAHDIARRVTTPEGYEEPLSYAMLYNKQYQRFKNKKAQVQEGTPLEELPFIPQAKRLELKALNIHTAESLAAISDRNLKSLGMGGRELKNQAQAYLDQARDSSTVSRLAADNDALREQIRLLQEERSSLLNGVIPQSAAGDPTGAAPPGQDEGGEDDGTQDGGEVSKFESWDDDDIKGWIKEKRGTAPRGNPSHATLVAMADELDADAGE
jgi:hypothetical protein